MECLEKDDKILLKRLIDAAKKKNHKPIDGVWIHFFLQKLILPPRLRDDNQFKQSLNRLKKAQCLDGDYSSLSNEFLVKLMLFPRGVSYFKPWKLLCRHVNTQRIIAAAAVIGVLLTFLTYMRNSGDSQDSLQPSTVPTPMDTPAEDGDDQWDGETVEYDGTRGSGADQR